MPIQFDKFDQQKVNRLKTHLDSQAEKGSPKFYEIMVDSLKAVQKTDDPKEFEGYEDYMTPDTQELRIIIYNSGASPRNDKYVFSMKAKSSQEALEMGLDGIAFKMLNKTELSELKANRDKQLAESEHIQELNTEIADLQKELKEKEAYIAVMEDAILKAKANGNKIGGIEVSEMLMQGLELLIRRNTDVIAKVPALEGFAKMIDEDTQRKQSLTEPQAETEVSFTKKSESPVPPQASQLTEHETHFLNLFKIMQQKFNEEELSEVIELLDRLSFNKHQLEPIMQLLEQSHSTH
jgi:hypothetical protein